MNLMIDLETLDQKVTTAILSVGIVAFDKEGIKDELYVVPNLQEQLDGGHTVSAATLCWWARQSDQARKVFEEQETKSVPLAAAFKQIHMFIRKYKDANIYSYGADFDIPILKYIYDSANTQVPWYYGRVRCLRTWCDDNNLPYKSAKDPNYTHNALQDARDQAQHMIDHWSPKPPLEDGKLKMTVEEYDETIPRSGAV